MECGALRLDLTIPTAKEEELAKIRRARSVLRLVKLKIINNEVGFLGQSRLLFFFALAFSAPWRLIFCQIKVNSAFLPRGEAASSDRLPFAGAPQRR